MPSRISDHTRPATVLTRHRRGAALLTTVLAVAVAASIVVVLTNLALSDLRTASAAQGLADARAAASAAASGFVAELNADPTGYLRRVSPHERARVCVADPTEPVVQPGEQWPHRCGTAWTYVDPVETTDARIEVHPPGVSGAQMRVVSFATSGVSSAAKEMVLHRSSASSWTVLTDEDLTLSQVNATTSATEISGASFYSAKNLNSSTPNVSYTRSLFAGEAGVAGSVTGTNLRAIAGDPSAEDIRDHAPNRRSTDQMVASVETARGDACRGVAPVNVAVEDNNHSLELCLAHGQILTDITGALRAVPDNVASYLITTELVASEPVVRVWTSTKPVGVGPHSGNLLSGIGGVVNAGNHPGGLQFWSELGVFYPPVSGLVFTDADVQLGICTTFHTGGTCPVRPGSDGPGMRVAVPMTVVAGTPSRPASAWFGSPVRRGPHGERLGVVAYSKVLFPYWARPTNAALDVHAAIVAFGRGADPATSQVHAHPANLSSNAPSNRGGALTVHGSIAAPRAGFLVGSTDPLFTSTKVAPAPTRDTEPPSMPSFERRWTVTVDRPVAPSDVCPAGCDTFLGGGSGGTGGDVTPPERPTGLTATVAVSSVTLSWNHNSDAHEYAITYRPAAGGASRIVRVPATECSGTACSRAVTGLANGVRYDFTVTAIGSTGARSAPSETVTAAPNGVPSAPTGLTASAEGIYRVRLKWVRPGGAIPDGYKVLRDGVVVATVDSETWLDSSLGAAAEPAYTVVAYNSAGDSPASETVTVSLMPGAPTNLALTNTGPDTGPGTVTLEWGTSPGTVTGYKVQRSTSPVRPAASSTVATVPAGTSSWVDPSPPQGRPTYYWVFAYNSGGDSITATEQVMVRPSAPTGISVDVEGVDPVASWDLPPAGQQVDSWDVRVDGTVVATVANSGLSEANPPTATLSGLPAVGVVTVTAKNSGGGTRSAGVHYGLAPPMPSSFTYTDATTSSLSFEWAASPLATRYEIERQAPAFSGQETGTSRTVTAQQSGQTQNWRVRACNEAGCSEWTSWAAMTTGGFVRSDAVSSNSAANKSGTDSSFTVPAGVKSVFLQATGGRGAAGARCADSGNAGGRAFGANARGIRTVAPGDTLVARTGKQGNGRFGGWPGGGDGTPAGTAAYCGNTFLGGGAGGGYSRWVHNSTVVLVAGAGGGGGSSTWPGAHATAGGAGGTVNGANAAGGVSTAVYLGQQGLGGGGGRGNGTASPGGGSACVAADWSCANGVNGGSYAGGAGSGWGGGGGAGYGGGGGGGHPFHSTFGSGFGAGGGGGSSYASGIADLTITQVTLDEGRTCVAWHGDATCSGFAVPFVR